MSEKIVVKQFNTETLKRYFNQQVIAIPELQRNFVWNNSRLRDLADSIYKGYSIGTFTIWDASKNKENFLRHHKGILPYYSSKSNDRIHYVIDGQQRLSVLWSFFNPNGIEMINDNGNQFHSKNICFTFNKDENGLNFSYIKKGPDNRRYISLCDILSDDFTFRFKHLKKKRFQILRDCREKFLKYPFIFVYIRHDMKLDNLRQTFIRLNTRGLTLRSVDRNYAYATRVHLREYIGRIKERLGILKTIDDTPLQELLYMIFKSEEKKSRFNSIAVRKIFQKIDSNNNYRLKFEREKKVIAESVARAEGLLRTFGVKSVKYLPSISMVSILSTFYYYYRKDKLTPYQKKQIIKWFWHAALSSRYTGKGYYSYAAKDIVVFTALAKGKRKEFYDMNKIDVSVLDDAQYYINKSSVVRAFYCLLALQKPKEFFDVDIPIKLEDPNYRERKENHHIYPQDLMEGVVPSRKYNSIVNICFLPKSYNASFNSDPPYEYLKSEKIDKNNIQKILKSHLIPQFVLLKHGGIKEDFSKYYLKRRELLKKLFEKFACAKIFE